MHPGRTISPALLTNWNRAYATRGDWGQFTSIRQDVELKVAEIVEAPVPNSWADEVDLPLQEHTEPRGKGERCCCRMTELQSGWGSGRWPR